MCVRISVMLCVLLHVCVCVRVRVWGPIVGTHRHSARYALFLELVRNVTELAVTITTVSGNSYVRMVSCAAKSNAQT